MALILLAADTKFHQQSVRAILEASGHEVIEARNSLEAARILTRTTVDFLLTDIYMPDMGGYELILDTAPQYP